MEGLGSRSAARNPKRHQMFQKCCLFGGSWRILGATWGPLGAKLRPEDAKREPKIKKKSLQKSMHELMPKKGRESGKHDTKMEPKLVKINPTNN